MGGLNEGMRVDVPQTKAPDKDLQQNSSITSPVWRSGSASHLYIEVMGRSVVQPGLREVPYFTFRVA